MSYCRLNGCLASYSTPDALKRHQESRKCPILKAKKYKGQVMTDQGGNAEDGEGVDQDHQASPASMEGVVLAADTQQPGEMMAPITGFETRPFLNLDAFRAHDAPPLDVFVGHMDVDDPHTLAPGGTVYENTATMPYIIDDTGIYPVDNALAPGGTEYENTATMPYIIDETGSYPVDNAFAWNQNSLPGLDQQGVNNFGNAFIMDQNGFQGQYDTQMFNTVTPPIDNIYASDQNLNALQGPYGTQVFDGFTPSFDNAYASDQSSNGLEGQYGTYIFNGATPVIPTTPPAPSFQPAEWYNDVYGQLVTVLDGDEVKAHRVLDILQELLIRLRH